MVGWHRSAWSQRSCFPSSIGPHGSSHLMDVPSCPLPAAPSSLLSPGIAPRPSPCLGLPPGGGDWMPDTRTPISPPTSRLPLASCDFAPCASPSTNPGAARRNIWLETLRPRPNQWCRRRISAAQSDQIRSRPHPRTRCTTIRWATLDKLHIINAPYCTCTRIFQSL